MAEHAADGGTGDAQPVGMKRTERVGRELLLARRGLDEVDHGGAGAGYRACELPEGPAAADGRATSTL